MKWDVGISYEQDVLYDYVVKNFCQTVLVPLDGRQAYGAWSWSFYSMSLINSFVRTNESRFMELLECAIKHAFSYQDADRGVIDQYRNRVVNSWGVLRGDVWINVVTQPGRILAPTIESIALCIKNNLSFDSKIIDKCILTVDEFMPDFVSMGDEGLFARPSRGDWEPLNHAVSMGRALLHLGKLTNDRRYLIVVEKLARFFKNSLFLEQGNSYAWAYRPNFYDRKRGFPTNFWKADIDLEFVVDCYKYGIVFEEIDIIRFVNTFKKVIVKSGFINCRVSEHKSVSIREKVEKVGLERIYGICGWMILSKYDDEIESMIEHILVEYEDLFPDGWFGCPRSIYGYSYKK